MKNYYDFANKEPSYKVKEVEIEVFSIKLDLKNEDDLKNIADHIITQYATVTDISELAELRGCTTTEYINYFVLPDLGKAWKTAAGEFGEIIASDILEGCYGYTIPRYKLKNKPDCNVPAPLVDVIGYKLIGEESDEKDILCLSEVKTTFSKYPKQAEKNVFEEINVKLLDNIRNSKTIIFYYNQARIIHDAETTKHIRRFMDKSEKNYVVEKYGFTIAEGPYPASSEYDFIVSKLQDNNHLIYVHTENLKDIFIDGYTRRRK